MKTAAPINPSRRRIWPWVVSFCLAPFVIMGAVVFSFLSLDRDGAALRRQVMAASDGSWHTKVQLSVGRITLGLVRTGLSLVKHQDMTDARLALSSISCASVGVYARAPKEWASWSREKLFLDADRTMNRRGWVRLVGVTNKQESALVYVPGNSSCDGPIDICLSVLGERELVIVTGTVNANGLAELFRRHAGDGLARDLKLAKF